jgi:hypothetical protein
VTFGPIGRIAASLAMLLPLIWFGEYAGVWGIVGVPIWSLLLVKGLRDIWQPIRVPDSPEPVADEPLSAIAPQNEDDEGIGRRPGSRRW